jgi:hypothetical protein
MGANTMLEKHSVDCILACERLCHDFGWHIDHRDYPAFLELFTEDGVFERGGLVSRGHDELSQFLEGRPLDMVTRHLFTGVRITPRSAQAATGTSSCFVYRTSATADQTYPLQIPAPRVVEFEDDFVRTAQGWRFERRRVSHIFA